MARIIRTVALSPDGRLAVTAGGSESETHLKSSDNSIRVWDLATGKELMRFAGHSRPVSQVQFAPDSNRFLSSGLDGRVKLWDIPSKKLFASLNGEPYVADAEISEDGFYILGRGTNRVHIWDARTAKEICSIGGGQRPYFLSAHFSPDARFVVTVAYKDNSLVRVWDAKTGLQVRQFAGHSASAYDAVFVMGGLRVVSGSLDGTVRLWDFQSGKELRRIVNPGAVRRVLASPDGRRCLAAWSNGDDLNLAEPIGASLWDLDTGQELARFPAGDAPVAFAPDGTTFLTLGKAAEVRASVSGKITRRIGLAH